MAKKETVKISVEVGNNGFYREFSLDNYEDRDWEMIVLEMIDSLLDQKN